MLKLLFRHFPSRLFCLSNLLFWLVLNTLAADHSYRMRTAYGMEVEWLEVWWQFLPWWGNWAIITPFIMAAVRSIELDEARRGRFVAQNLLLMSGVMLTYWSMTIVEVALLFGDGLSMSSLQAVVHDLLRSPMHLDILVYIAVASIGFTLNYYARNKQQAIRNEQLSGQLLRTELQALKSQLSPHFLFNTLNTISGLVRLNLKDDAVMALSELSKMFRKVLENQKTQLTSLQNEMEFIQSYLAIQKMRFENKLAVELDVDPATLDVEIPFMLLHTLVENAVQHGSQLESDHNLLRLVARQGAGTLLITLTNKACQHGDHAGFGIGLENCRQRLHHLYPQGAELHCNKTADGFFETRLIIPQGELDV